MGFLIGARQVHKRLAMTAALCRTAVCSLLPRITGLSAHTAETPSMIIASFLFPSLPQICGLLHFFWVVCDCERFQAKSG